MKVGDKYYLFGFFGGCITPVTVKNVSKTRATLSNNVQIILEDVGNLSQPEHRVWTRNTPWSYASPATPKFDDQYTIVLDREEKRIRFNRNKEKLNTLIQHVNKKTLVGDQLALFDQVADLIDQILENK